jgi:hypothetical protein
MKKFPILWIAFQTGLDSGNTSVKKEFSGRLVLPQFPAPASSPAYLTSGDS